MLECRFHRAVGCTLYQSPGDMFATTKDNVSSPRCKMLKLDTIMRRDRRYALARGFVLSDDKTIKSNNKGVCMFSEERENRKSPKMSDLNICWHLEASVHHRRPDNSHGWNRQQVQHKKPATSTKWGYAFLFILHKPKVYFS